MSLFNKGSYTLHVGRTSNWTINCAEFNQDDWECVAELIVERYPNFERVIGISYFGEILQGYLEHYATKGGLLIVDDILYLQTMQAARLHWRTRKNYVNHQIQGFVIFSCLPCPSWVRTLWQLDVRTDKWDDPLL
jgi:hypothetical protein